LWFRKNLKKNAENGVEKCAKNATFLEASRRPGSIWGPKMTHFLSTFWTIFQVIYFTQFPIEML